MYFFLEEMSDTGSSLAITTEKKPHRPGGCVGIFFQLFDWNRRFAKKNLFPKKLLPPARAKLASKKFGADDKLPKLRLISDENSGGFPNVKKNGTRNFDSEQKNEMQTPGLVARLMGLDSMPSIQGEKLKKISSSQIGSDRGGRFANDHCPLSKQDENLEKVGTRHELRPQKLQKTGPYDRHAITRFGAEALQFKNVLLRSSKCKHHPKLATPVKSPKSLSGRNTSRLIGAATRILEPGLQSRNRAKCALPYSNKMQHTRSDEIMVEATTALSQDPLESSTYYANATLLSRGKSSCKNCGNLLNIVDSRPNLEEQPSVFVLSASNYVDRSCPGLERIRPRSPVSSLEPDKERIFKSRENLTDPAVQAMDSVRPRAEPISDMTPLQRVGQTRWQLESQICNTQQDSSSSICYKHKIPRQNQVLMGRDRIPTRPKLSNMQSNRAALATNAINESKDFIPLNRSSSGRARSRLPAKMDNCRYESETKLNDKRDGPLSSVRKRRSVNVTRQDDITGGFVSSTVDKQRNINGNAMAEKMVGRVVQPTNPNCIESRLARLRESNKTSGSGNKDNGVISFTFSSPMKQKGGIPAETKGRRDQNDSTCNSILQKNSVMDKISGQTCFQKSFPLTGDTLGVLLEQKLKELTSQENDELAVGGTPKRTSATILQELISALTIERPFHQNDVAIRRNEECDSSYCGHTSELHATFQKKTGAQVKYSNDNNNLSPLSVLEASFSNESCFSSSLDDSSVHKLHIDFMDCSYNEPQHIVPDANLLDSATSLNKGRPGIQMVADFVNHISEMLCSIDLVDSRLKGSKLAHAKEIVLNAELVFGTALQHNKDKAKAFSISRFLVDELETLASVLWTNSSCFSGFEDTEGNLLKGFLFDCVIEYLESRYDPCFKCGIKTSRNLPLCMNTEMLIREVVEEIRSWTGLAGFIPDDEIIEREMSCCLGKWLGFEIEAFETGVAIDGDILQILVDEIVLDLWQGKPGCSCGP